MLIGLGLLGACGGTDEATSSQDASIGSDGPTADGGRAGLDGTTGAVLTSVVASLLAMPLA